ncbi:hypothetical protein H0H81_004316 [Sphagnurus paluster]|uniref:MIF4G domain-containing protein n=1 Tax=Sphagnurus paluster TaxID=117069 RepID=A0A9P7GLA9_9AGAR|nr:hypothetical protein H0H81_004316 [Sphagnurus paluster]
MSTTSPATLADLDNIRAQLANLTAIIQGIVPTAVFPSAGSTGDSATAPATNFVPPITTIQANDASSSLRSLFPDVEAAYITAIIAHEFPAGDLYKLDLRYRDQYPFNGATSQLGNSNKDYETPDSVIIPLYTYFAILSAHIPKQRTIPFVFFQYLAHLQKLVSEYEWAVVLSYHTAFFNRRRAEMIDGDYSRWALADPVLVSEHFSAAAVATREVKALLDKLTMENFDSISEQIISWVNTSRGEKDGRTFIQVIKLVYEKATDEGTWAEMYARLCRKMMERISPKLWDDDIKNSKGKPIVGGQLFRKYLLNRCQEDFECGWINKEATAAAAASKSLVDQAAYEKNKKVGVDEVILYSDEYYGA